MFDGAAFGEELADLVRGFVARETQPLVARIGELERALAAANARPSAEDQGAIVARAVAAAVEALPRPAAPELPDIGAMVRAAVAEIPPVEAPALPDIGAMVKAEVAQAVAAIPPVEAPALPDIGAMVRSAVAEIPPVEAPELPDIAGMVKAEVADAVVAIPAVEPPALPDIGAMVRAAVAEIPAVEPPALPDIAGMVKAAVEALPKAAPGQDGIGLADALIDREGQLVVTMADGRVKQLGVVVGQDGKDVDMAAVEASITAKVAAIPAPKDGKDGFSLKDFDAEMRDGGRTLVLSLEDGEFKHTVELGLDTMIYRDVFKDGHLYERGDVVTWAGSTWHCNAPTGERPGEGSKDWTLAVKKGRDGKPGEPGRKGDPGQPGRPGRDLTQLGFDGGKH